MSNSYYNHTNYPISNTPASSAQMRAELDLITAGFNKLPELSTHANKIVVVNSAGTALDAVSTLTGVVFSGSSIDSTPIGATTPSTGKFTDLTATGTVSLGSSVAIAGGTINNTAIGGTTRAAGLFTTLAANAGITGALTGNVTGNVTGDVTGNITATTGSSSLATLTVATTLTASKVTGVGTPTVSSDATPKTYVDTAVSARLALAGGTMSGAIAMGTSKITGLGDPTNLQDAATKNYVDSVAQGLDIKASVKAATTANITLSGTQTIDGIAVIAGNRVLVKNQSTAANNGIYVASASTWTRSTDADTWDELVSAFVFVEGGTANAESGWTCTIDAGGTLGSTAVTWAQFSGAGQITAGAGLTKTGNTLDVGTASATRIVVNADSIDLALSGATAGTYTSVTVDTYGRVTAGTSPTTISGYGITDAYTKTEVDAQQLLDLKLTGGTMSGAIAMGTNKITGLGTPTLGTDAVTKTYADGLVAGFLLLTGGTMSGALAMGGNKITGLGTPTLDTDASTKLYVDSILGSATSAATSATAAQGFATDSYNSSVASASSASASAASAASAGGAEILYVIDGGGAPVSSGSKGTVEIPFNCTINRVTLVGDASGTVTVDLKKCDYATFPSTVSITNGTPPALTAARKSQDSALTGWTSTLAAGDILEYTVPTTATSVTRLSVLLKVTRT